MARTAKQQTGKARGKPRSAPVLQHSRTPSSLPRPAVFIDRDGTLNEMVYDDAHGLMDSPRKPAQVRMIRNAGKFLRAVGKLGYVRVVVTNQPGMAKGTLTLEGLAAVNRRLAGLVEKEGGYWDDIRFCPHHPKVAQGPGRAYRRRCACRKPLPGMLLEAAAEHGIDLRSSWMVGDGLNDVQAGNAAGCKTILISRLKIDQVAKFFELKHGMPSAIARDLNEALRIIRRATRKR